MIEVTAVGTWQERSYGPITVAINSDLDLEQEKLEVIEKLRVKAGSQDFWGTVVDQATGIKDHPKNARKIAIAAGFTELAYRRTYDGRRTHDGRRANDGHRTANTDDGEAAVDIL